MWLCRMYESCDPSYILFCTHLFASFFVCMYERLVSIKEIKAKKIVFSPKSPSKSASTLADKQAKEWQRYIMVTIAMVVIKLHSTADLQ